jgi:hypothetical protein
MTNKVSDKEAAKVMIDIIKERSSAIQNSLNFLKTTVKHLEKIIERNDFEKKE